MSWFGATKSLDVSAQVSGLMGFDDIDDVYDAVY
jgi:hypothetical protein